MKKLLLILSFILCMTKAYSQEHNDSIREVLEETPAEKKIDVYQQVILNLWLNHPDSAMHYAREAMRFSKGQDDLRTKAIATRLVGGVHYYQGHYDSTIKYSYEAYGLSEALGDSSLMTSAMNNIGLAYYNVGSFPEALEFLLRALNLKIKIKQVYGLSQTLNNVGLVYTELKDYDKARVYFNEAMKEAEKYTDNHQILYSLNNIGFTYIDQNDLPLARSYFTRALRLAATIDNAIWHSASFSGMGQVYLREDSVDKARTMFRESLKLSESINNVSGIAEAYSYYATIFSKAGKLDSALLFVRKSQALASQNGDKDQLINNYDLLKNIFVRKKKYDSALYYQSQFINLKDSVFNVNLARSIKDIQLQIEREESKTKLAAKDDQIRKITTQTYFLVATVGLFIVVLFFLFLSYKEQRRLTNDLAKTNHEIMAQTEEIHSQRDKLALSHTELEAAKELIHQKNVELSKLNDQLQTTVDVRTRELEQANKELKVVNLELDNFIYRSSHDIRGPLVRLLGICHVALLDITDQKARDYFTMFYESAQQLNEIIDRLKIVSHINEVNIQPSRVNFNEILSQVLDKLKTMHGFSEIEIVNEGKINDWYSDPFLLELILLNMIENSVRFQKKDGEGKKFIRVKTLKEGPNVHMKIIDNGIGIQEPDMENLYKMFSKSARDHRNIGLGLYIVKQCLGKLNGSINLVQNEQGYTEFEIIHPNLTPQLT